MSKEKLSDIVSHRLLPQYFNRYSCIQKRASLLNKRLKEIILFFTVIITLTTTASYLLVKGYLYPLIITSVKKVIEEKTGQEASIEKLTLSFFPPKLILNNFSISGDESDPLEVKITEIAASLNPLQAMSGTIIITNLGVKSPIIRLSANEERISHLKTLPVLASNDTLIY